ncbi:HRDC domain-containing protein [Sulfuricurvum sp.]|uniref:HRDC domain-containing protein n=1 Tax=Sulfuricurvum sp. TaxID=2025608 RepID=UPI003BB507DA
MFLAWTIANISGILVSTTTSISLFDVTSLRTVEPKRHSKQSAKSFLNCFKISYPFDFNRVIVVYSTISLAEQLPTSKEEMLNISGIGEVKFERYGELFLELTRELSAKERD